MYKEIEEILDDFYKLYYKIEKLNIDNSIKCLTANEMRIINSVDDETTMNDLANRLDITIGTVSSAVKKLEQKQFLHRIKDDVDKRKVYIKLTLKGNIVKDFHGNFNKSLFQRITSNVEKKEIKVFEKVLREINSKLYEIKENLEPILITKAQIGKKYIVYEVRSDDVTLKYLVKKGISIGKEIRLLEKDKKTITIIIDKQEKIINIDDASSVLCIKKEEK